MRWSLDSRTGSIRLLWGHCAKTGTGPSAALPPIPTVMGPPAGISAAAKAWTRTAGQSRWAARHNYAAARSDRGALIPRRVSPAAGWRVAYGQYMTDAPVPDRTEPLGALDVDTARPARTLLAAKLGAMALLGVFALVAAALLGPQVGSALGFARLVPATVTAITPLPAEENADTARCVREQVAVSWGEGNTGFFVTCGAAGDEAAGADMRVAVGDIVPVRALAGWDSVVVGARWPNAILSAVLAAVLALAAAAGMRYLREYRRLAAAIRGAGARGRSFGAGSRGPGAGARSAAAGVSGAEAVGAAPATRDSGADTRGTSPATPPEPLAVLRRGMALSFDALSLGKGKRVTVHLDFPEAPYRPLRAQIPGASAEAMAWQRAELRPLGRTRRGLPAGPYIIRPASGGTLVALGRALRPA